MRVAFGSPPALPITVREPVASPLVEKAVPFYAVGLLVMLGGATQTGVHGLVAAAALVVGIAVFSLGIVVEERTDR